MNIQLNLRKIFNAIKSLQIPDKDMTPENASRAVYLAGMLHSAKLFMNLYNGDMVEKTLDFELEQLKETIH